MLRDRIFFNIQRNDAIYEGKGMGNKIKFLVLALLRNCSDPTLNLDLSLSFGRSQTHWKFNMSTLHQSCFPSCASPLILFLWWMALLVIWSMKQETWDQPDSCSLPMSHYHQVPLILRPKEFLSPWHCLIWVFAIFAWVSTRVPNRFLWTFMICHRA